MKPAAYPFSAIVGQDEMKLALLLAAVDWRLGVLLLGDKGSGKTTTARGLAALLPAPAPFVNLPIGVTEDRLLGGLHLERTLQGDPALKPGLLSEAHGGVLYVDEVNLLAAHLGDALLDTAASGVHVIEREGLSATHQAEFVLLGSMNPEEGSLRPQLLDRFALSVHVSAPLDPAERQVVMERRIAFDRDSGGFSEQWSASQRSLHMQIVSARAALNDVLCASEILGQISTTMCESGVRSLRADLAALRASIGYAALSGDASVEPHHVAVILPMVLGHRTRTTGRSTSVKAQTTEPQPQTSGSQSQPGAHSEPDPKKPFESAIDRIFLSQEIHTPAIQASFGKATTAGTSALNTRAGDPGCVTGNRLSESPVELDIRATLTHALRENGSMRPRRTDLHERVRTPATGTRYIFVIDSSGSHAAQQRMGQVKGAIASVLERSFRRGDEIVMIIFRGTSAEVILEPTQILADALATLEYLPTGGRTPLAAGLERASEYVSSNALLVLLTDGRANVPLHSGDAWRDAIAAAHLIRGTENCSAIVVDTEVAAQRLGQCVQLAETLCAIYLSLDELAEIEVSAITMKQLSRQGR